MDPQDLKSRFEYHPPKNEETKEAHENVRLQLHQTALVLTDLIPDGREKSTAITKLEEAMFWANAAIARSGGA